MNQGLAPSTRKVYASAKHRFLDFCAQENSLPFLGSALPSSEDVLIRFCCHLADTLHCSSITFQQSYPFSSRRVCLLHWLVCLWLQRVLRCCGVSNVTKAQMSVSIFFITDIMSDFCIVDRYFILYLSLLLLLFYYYYYHFIFVFFVIFVFMAIPVK